MIEWLEDNSIWLTVLGIGSGLFFLVSIFLIPLVIVRLPVDYFVRDPVSWRKLSRAALLRRVLKNLLGIGLIGTGLLMLILPGQGLLTLLVGFSLLDFPAKRYWQLRLIGVPAVGKSIDWIREKANRVPLKLPNRP
ncbi:MAG: hypothetical protein AAGJ81_02980 [Verrucomicrobiota bacterium]